MMQTREQLAALRRLRERARSAQVTAVTVAVANSGTAPVDPPPALNPAHDLDDLLMGRDGRRR